MSRSLKELSVKAARARDELCKAGGEPTVSELAEYLGVTPEEAAEAVAAGTPALSLTCAEDGGEFDLPSESRENSIIDRLALRQCLDELPEEDRDLLILRYFRGKTQSETAQILGMTQVSVSRRERRLLDGLRKQLI